ncbi:pyridoxamine 5'-phosphate oxidase family protein [Actinomycetospora cinnamomea]|uniref:Nitroimidazol reductase NimA-like FMN-containing flavoprotein (Pyridoxamine 5'-phosphate oxidase superfamily) n=1 Tax=Actinomycetospora cinnamomea TaxID=663609 RepID=A0A2U1F8C7_9PSEU|nr:pyridoxamine 5'-phosphate oxidase family protein [Actinomycetospora cinnamomea]PVZ08416.1 nitroimidazol reductase NimA-like FMN-containing flavoprotein (pyridoxamine 5'-phosphate oxidase superfamily) [Actinomycetospora cinnamomea]
MQERTDLVEMDRAECFRLLGGLRVGRMVFTDRTVPMVHPVNFSLAGEDVILRTSGGGKLAAAMSHGTVAFEADDFDADTHAGWSVVIVGHAEIVNDIDELVALADPARRPWAPGRTAHVIRIRSEQVTGRRLGAASPSTDPAPEATPSVDPGSEEDRPPYCTDSA